MAKSRPSRRGHQGPVCWRCSTKPLTSGGAWRGVSRARVGDHTGSRWVERRRLVELADRCPGGSPMHGVGDHGKRWRPGLPGLLHHRNRHGGGHDQRPCRRHRLPFAGRVAGRAHVRAGSVSRRQVLLPSQRPRRAHATYTLAPPGHTQAAPWPGHARAACHCPGNADLSRFRCRR